MWDIKRRSGLEETTGGRSIRKKSKIIIIIFIIIIILCGEKEEVMSFEMKPRDRVGSKEQGGISRTRDSPSQMQSRAHKDSPLRAASNSRSSPINCSSSSASSITFCLGVSGWLFSYYFGVVKVLKESGKSRNCKVVGSSGGALAGLFLIDGVSLDFDAMIDFICSCATHARSTISGPFYLRQYCIEAHTRFVADDTYLKCGGGRVSVSVTRIGPSEKKNSRVESSSALRSLMMMSFSNQLVENIRVSEFMSREHFLSVMLATSHLVPLSGMLPVHVEGVGYCIDGGATDLNLVTGFTRTGTFNRVHCLTEIINWSRNMRRRRKRDNMHYTSDNDDEDILVGRRSGCADKGMHDVQKSCSESSRLETVNDSWTTKEYEPLDLLDHRNEKDIADDSNDSESDAESTQTIDSGMKPISVCTICPFYFSRATIKPSRWVPPWWALYPPTPCELYKLYELGQHDAERWIQSIENQSLDQNFGAQGKPVSHEEHADLRDNENYAHDQVMGYLRGEVDQPQRDSLTWVFLVLLRTLGFNLVYAELFVQTVVSFFMFVLCSPSMLLSLPNVNSSTQFFQQTYKNHKNDGKKYYIAVEEVWHKWWERTKQFGGSLISPRLALCAIPELKQMIGFDEKEIRKLSLVFRFLQYLI